LEGLRWNYPTIMRIRSLTLSNFRRFGPNPVTVVLTDLTAFMGANGAGKTAALQALGRLFGAIAADRRLTRADFYIPPSEETDEDPDELSLFLEARLEFPELADGEVGAVPQCFNQMAVEAPGEPPFCRVRLEAIWKESHQPEGEIEETLSWVRTAAAQVGDHDTVKMDTFDRARIQVLYVPASRDPARHLRQVAGSLLQP
jgi:putative ATP-dependent endonuclease of the OLD family